MHMSADGGCFVGNNIRNTYECGLYLAHDVASGTFVARNITVSGNTIDTVSVRDISGSGIEGGGRHITISGNTIMNCAQGGVTLGSGQHTTISGNTIKNCAITTSSYAGIYLVSNNSGSDTLTGITISGNHVYDDQGTPTTRNAVRVIGSYAPTNCLIEGNNFAGTTFTDAIFDFASAAWAKAFFRHNNRGTADDYPVPVAGRVAPGAGTGSYSVTGVGFQPRFVVLTCGISSATDIQSCTTTIDSAGACLATYNAAVNSGGVRSGQSTDAWKVIGAAGGATVAQATFTSMDADGFTVNITTGYSSLWVRYVCYP